MTRTPGESDHMPIYEDLVRELGDVVAEAQMAAEHTQYKAIQLLGGRHTVPHQSHPPRG